MYERDVSMKEFWENDSIIWSEGIKQMDLVIKDDSGGSGHAHKRKDSEKFFPTKMRITVVQVSAGAKYDPSLVPNLPPRKDDGGEPKAAVNKKTEKEPESCCDPWDRSGIQSQFRSFGRSHPSAGIDGGSLFGRAHL